MRIEYRHTSLEAFKAINVTPKAYNVWNAIKILQVRLKRGCTDREILEFLRNNYNSNWEHNSSTARRNWLSKKKFIEESGVITNKDTGRIAITWKTTKLQWKDGINELEKSL